MKRRFLIYMSVFLSIPLLTLPRQSEQVVVPTEGRASEATSETPRYEFDSPFFDHFDSLLDEEMRKVFEYMKAQEEEAIRLWKEAERKALEEKERQERIAAAKRAEASRTNVPPGSIADRIAACEGGQKYLNRDHGHSNSTASGKYGFINSTWDGVDGVKGNGFRGYSRAMHAPEHVQDEAFYILWNNGKGAGHWAASRHCWG